MPRAALHSTAHLDRSIDRRDHCGGVLIAIRCYIGSQEAEEEKANLAEADKAKLALLADAGKR